MRKRRVIAALLLCLFIVPSIVGVAFAEEDMAETFPSSNNDFNSYDEPVTASTWQMLSDIYRNGMSEAVGSGTSRYREGFFWSHGVTVNSGQNYSLYSGGWTAHPAIYISVLPEAQLTVLPYMELGILPANADGWCATDNMSMNYWMALAHFFRYDSEKYNEAAKTKNGEIRAYIYLYKKTSSSNGYKKVGEANLLIASRNEHTAATSPTIQGAGGLKGRFYRSTGLYNDPLNTDSSLGFYPFDSNDSHTVVSATPANNSVLFYNLENSATYKVTVEIRVSYTGSDGKYYGMNGGKPVFSTEIVRGFSDAEKDGRVSVSLCGYSIRGNGDGLYEQVLGIETRKASAIDASRYADEGIDLSGDNPIAIMQDISLIRTSPGQGKTQTEKDRQDAAQISSAFKLFRRLALTVCVFGMGWAAFQIVLLDASGFALIRLKQALFSWLGLIVAISGSVALLSVLVQALFFGLPGGWL